MVALQELDKSGKFPTNDLTGQRFGRLVVVEWAGRDNYSHVVWKCLCDCGNFHKFISSDSKQTKSCGCLRTEAITKHGLSSSRVHNVWTGIRSRCLNPKDKSFANYGGGGRGMFDKWQDDFQAFYDHVGEPPSDKHSIDRIDNERGYYPGNLRWATINEQNSNRRNTIWVDFGGQRYPLSDLAKQYNLSVKVAERRLKLGWDIEKILTTPVRFLKPYQKSAQSEPGQSISVSNSRVRTNASR